MASRLAGPNVSPLRLLIAATPPIPRSNPAIFLAVSLSFSQMAANTAPNIGDKALKMASMDGGSTRTATE